MNNLLIRAITAFLLLPGIFAGILPWLIAALDPWKGNAGIPADAGLMVGIAGLIILLRSAWDFYVSGLGTLAPWSPPIKLVSCGLYRCTRNPMYLGVLLIVAGWSIGYGSPMLLGYLFFAAAAFHLRIVFQEEPWLAERYPKQWPHYAASVQRWQPNFTACHIRTAGK